MAEAAERLQLDLRARRRAEVRAVITMSIPVVVTMIARAVMDVVDFTLMTFLHDPAAQAAILPAQVINWTYTVLGMGTVSIVSTFTSQSLGRGDERACGAYAWQTIYIAVGSGLLGIGLVPLLPWLFGLLQHEPAVQRAETVYAQIALLTAGPTVAAAGLSWFFIGVHRPWITMWSALEANVVNVVVSWALVFGAFGLEPLGIAGAAWGTLVAVWYRMLRLAIALLAPGMAARFHTRRAWRPSGGVLLRMLRFGLPTGLQWTSDVMVWAIFITVLVGTKFGTTHLIATNAA
ncbi:MAG TPA: MATE family efflux transporter [Phycisphaerae bacterium]|nr:MATE family efflux transporter [Phycisphaerae bacterium]HNU44093.1 MATE family efflux transporter [Phycisphaerae bacterium]